MARYHDTAAACSKAEGDRICRMVLELVKAIAKDPSVRPIAEREPARPSPVYNEYERLVKPRIDPLSPHHPPEVA